MKIRTQSHVGVRLGATFLAAAMSSLASPVEAATDGVNGVTITSINLYAGTHLTGTFIFFSPAKPGMGGCANAAGNAVWIDWSSAIQPRRQGAVHKPVCVVGCLRRKSVTGYKPEKIDERTTSNRG